MTRNDRLLSFVLVSAIALLLWFGLDGDGLQWRDIGGIPAALGGIPAALSSLIP